ncbi:hypothetical protein BH24ACT13_BH24ACT13_08090 [soil metagenome]|jgi:hypothetical protein
MPPAPAIVGPTEPGGAEFAGVVLAAGAGTRLRPLTTVRPKALCPILDRPLLDWALDRVTPYATAVAVNAHHLADQVVAHLSGRPVHLALEHPRALGTAGALANLRDWIDGRPVLVANADTWHAGDPAAALAGLVAGWDGERTRLLCTRDPDRGDFAELRYVGSALLPWTVVRELRPVPSDLYEVSWRGLHARGALDLHATAKVVIDCGTPATYLAANMAASGGASVVGKDAVVDGELVRSVVWPGGVVGRGERLVDAVRVGKNLTVVPAG